MQVLCVGTLDSNADVQCPRCAQKFIVYFSRHSDNEKQEALKAVWSLLVEDHLSDSSSNPHRREPFNVPRWSGPARASAAALLSNAPI